MTLIQELARQNLMMQPDDDCVIIQDGEKHHLELEDIPFKYLVSDVEDYHINSDNEHIFKLKGRCIL